MIGRRTIKAGTLVSLECGEYSDHKVIGMFVALQDFYPLDELAKLIEQEKTDEDDFVDLERATPHLIRQGLLMEVRYDTLHLGNYELSMGNVEWHRYTGGVSSDA